MRRSNFKTAGIALAITGLTVLASCGSDSSGSDVEEIQVGLVLPISGSSATLGHNQSAGFNFVIDQINEAGGVESLGGAKIVVNEADDTSDPRIAADEARRLILQENVVAIAGFSTTNQVISSAPLLDQQKVTGLSVTGTTTGPGSYMFTNGFTVDGIAENSVNALDFLNEKQDGSLKRVSLAYQDYQAAQDAAAAEKVLLEERGYEVAGEVSLSGTATDLGPAVLKLQSQKPDVILSYALNDVGIRLHEARAANEISDAIWIGTAGGWSEKAVWEELGDDVAPRTLANRSFAVGYYDASLGLEAGDELVAAAQAAGVEADFGGHFIMGAQTARTLHAALENAGKTGEITKESVYQGMLDVQMSFDDGTIYLPRKEISFNDERKYNDQTGVVFQWTTEGEQQAVFPEEFASVEPRMQ